MLDAIKARLNSLEIPFSTPDEVILSFSSDKITNHIKNQTNLTDIPTGLTETAIDMVVGEFLFVKKSMGQLDISTLNFEAFAKQVQDGDTNVSYAVEANSTPEAKFEKFLEYLRHNETDFTRYRVLKW